MIMKWDISLNLKCNSTAIKKQHNDPWNYIKLFKQGVLDVK